MWVKSQVSILMEDQPRWEGSWCCVRGDAPSNYPESFWLCQWTWVSFPGDNGNLLEDFSNALLRGSHFCFYRLLCFHCAVKQKMAKKKKKTTEMGRKKQCPLKAHNPKLQRFPYETKNRNELCAFTGSHSGPERHSENHLLWQCLLFFIVKCWDSSMAFLELHRDGRVSLPCPQFLLLFFHAG